MFQELLYDAGLEMIVILLVSLSCVGLVRRCDPEEQVRIGVKEILSLFLVALPAGMVDGLWAVRQGLLPTGLELGVISGCLCFACVTDLQICKVYHFAWWPAGLAGVALWIEGTREPGTGLWISLLSLGLFTLAQQVLFQRLYGRADCHAFCICAMAEAALGMGMREYLIHGTLAFLILSLHQGIRKNIGKRGRLKVPVPFLPYITMAYQIVLLAAFFGKDCIFMRT